MFSPFPDKLWDRKMAAHLLNRAGFGGTPSEIDTLVAMGPEKAVNSFIHSDEDGDLYPRPELLMPDQMAELRRREKNAPTEEVRQEVRKELNQRRYSTMLDLRLWWLNRMRYTAAPLLEKATLFWHGHFATSNQKVDDPYLMWVQN